MEEPVFPLGQPQPVRVIEFEEDDASSDSGLQYPEAWTYTFFSYFYYIVNQLSYNNDRWVN